MGALQDSALPFCRAKQLPRGQAASGPRRCSSNQGHCRRATGSRHSSFWSVFLNTSFAHCIICFFLMKKDFRFSAVDLGLLKKIRRTKAQY